MLLMARPIGDRIKEVLAACDGQPSTVSDVWERIGGDIRNVSKYLHRAARHGFAVKEAGVFSAVPGWQQMVERPRFHPSPKAKQVNHIPQINSVFALGSINVRK